MLYIVTKRFIIKKMIMDLMKGEMLYESKCKGDAKIKLNMGESVILKGKLYPLFVLHFRIIF